MERHSRFTITDLTDLLDKLDRLAIPIWVDGGWGVDALLGEETRPHSDLDIVIEKHHVAALRALLEADGYTEVLRDDSSPHNFVLGTDGEYGKIVDFHVIELDADGNGIYGQDGDSYTAEALSGIGIIDGRQVKTIAPKILVAFHSGYTLAEKDFHDVSRLCAKYDIPLPEAYKSFLE